MDHTPGVAAVILYEHALLGEGIATRLRAEVGVNVVLACMRDSGAVLTALGLIPRVVVFERCGQPAELALAELAPQAELIDISTVVGRGPVSPNEVTGFERILRALRPARVPAPAPSPDVREGAVSG